MSHDSSVPSPAATTALRAPDAPDVYAVRRARLLDLLAAEPGAGDCPCVVVFAAPEQLRNADTERPYRADSDVVHLTGFHEPDTVLIMRPDQAVLHVRAKDPKMEVWTGRRAGAAGAAARTGLTCDDEKALSALLTEHLVGATSVWWRAGARDTDDAAIMAAFTAARQKVRKKGTSPRVLGDATHALGTLRLVKDEAAIRGLRAAAAASVAGHLRAARALRTADNERALAAELSYGFMTHGADRQAYPPIVAAGANACVLHYVDNNAPIAPDDLVLIDAGAEVAHMAGDITRTWPRAGRFSAAQAAVYDLVLAAHRAALDAVRPDATFEDLEVAARGVLVDGLLELGILAGERDTLLTRGPVPDDERRLASFFMHSIGHWLGHDVHDPCPYHDGSAKTPFAAGMALTVEPGLYFAPDDARVPEAYRGIGVRIEDDVLVTADGKDVLTAALPAARDAVEALVCGAH